MKKLIYLEDAVNEIARWIGYLDKDMISRIQIGLERLPSAQPEIEERMSETEQNVPNDDFISRKRAIDAIEAVFPVDPMKSEYAQGIACGAALSKTYIEQLPSAQPERQWIPIWDGDGQMPEVDEDGCSEYVLLSFGNASFVCIGRYQVDEDGGAFYDGDEEDPLTKIGLFVNAWMPLPEPYREDGEQE